jgi:hypothetical protein
MSGGVPHCSKATFMQRDRVKVALLQWGWGS